MSYDAKQVVEQFHLVFLSLLGRALDKRLYAVKGGCNLRFYFKSFRYSEDLDIDVQTISVTTLQNKVDGILNGKPIDLILKARKIVIQQVTAPKQTPTTQRWKIILSTDQSSLPLNTKIEFSRRGIDLEVRFDPIDSYIISIYNLQSFYANHYTGQAAVLQKIEALIGRSVTQARDIFDLHLLFNQGIKIILPFDRNQMDMKTAVSNALSISFGDFSSQVVSFLSPEYQEQYRDEEIWNRIQLSVIEHLQEEA